MKKLFYLFVFLISQTLVFSQVINIPDNNLKMKLLLADVNTYHYAKNAANQWIRIDTNSDGLIQQSEALLVVKLYINFQINPLNIVINSLSGLEYFYNLEYLDCRDNPLNNINLLASLNYLKVIFAANCQLTSINLAGLISLVDLDVSENNLTQIDLSGFPNLKGFGCLINNITTINCSNNPLLTSLTCGYNNLTSINIKNGINHDFSNLNGYYNDCWKTGNPNLTTICADASEVASVQSFLNGCGTAQAITITSNCGLSNEEFASNVGVYPNPFADKLTIDTTQSLDEYNSITIYNTLGSIVYNNSILTSINEIDLSNLPKGVYIANLSGKTKKASLKLIKN